MARLLPYPWSLCAPRHDAGATLSLEDGEEAEPFNLETLSFLSRSEGEQLPVIQGRSASVTQLSTHVMLNPHTEAGRRLAVLSIPSFSLEPTIRWVVQVGEDECVIPVAGAIRRASGREDPQEHNVDEVELRDSIELLSGYFREAVELTHDGAHPEFAAFANQQIACLNWKAIWKLWNSVSAGNEPPMAQVVKIAIECVPQICDVCERPRRMLVRRHELVPLGRVQELDSTCLRHLIHRPGRTVQEKAGPRQELLAVTRQETVDTPENRVIRDFLRLCQHRARAYERENSSAKEHRKVIAVRKLRSRCERLDAWSAIADAGLLVGTPRPNYVLQKDRRYHPLWIRYDQLRREEKAVDDIWPWGRVLWAEFIRGIVMGFLHGNAGDASSLWQPGEEVVAYIRQEQIAGSFLPAFSVSSRLSHSAHQSQMFLVHPAHAHLCPGVEELLPRLGAELALVFYPRDEVPKSPTGVIVIYTVLSLKTDAVVRNAMVTSLENTLESISQQNPRINVQGLLLRGEWAESQNVHNLHRGRVGYMAAFAGSRFWFESFPAALSNLVRETAG